MGHEIKWMIDSTKVPISCHSSLQSILVLNVQPFRYLAADSDGPEPVYLLSDPGSSCQHCACLWGGREYVSGAYRVPVTVLGASKGAVPAVPWK